MPFISSLCFVWAQSGKTCVGIYYSRRETQKRINLLSKRREIKVDLFLSISAHHNYT